MLAEIGPGRMMGHLHDDVVKLLRPQPAEDKTSARGFRPENKPIVFCLTQRVINRGVI